MATKPKAILSTHDGREASPITKASNVLFENGQTAQDILNDRQDAMISPVIENSSSMFKVGQGDNVDYSSNVVNGAYESMVLKGKTMVNCIQEPSSKDVVLPYEFADGQYVTINDTKESGALGVELKGQTLVNIHKSATYSLSRKNEGWYENLVAETNRISFEVTDTSTDGWRYLNLGELNLDMLKPNTKYLVYFGVANFPHNLGVRFMNGNATDKISNEAMVAQGSNWAILTTSSEIIKSEQVLYVSFTNVLGKVEVGNAMIFEYQEGMENWDIPYFTGMTSCKMPILRTVGKNLFDGELITGKIEDNGKPNTYVSTMCMSANYTRVQPNTTYNYKWIQELNSSRIFFYDANKNFIKKNENVISSTGGQFTTPSNCYYILFHLAINTNMASYTVVITESDDLTYEPYKSSILSLPEEVVLRSLPKGVCDTFNTRTGIYTKNIEEFTIIGEDGENWWYGINENEKTIHAQTNFPLNLRGMFYKNASPLLCDKMSWIPDSTDIEHIRLTTPNDTDYSNTIAIWIDKTKLSSYTSEEINKYIKSIGGITIQGRIINPIVTKINLPSTLKSWNTTTHIYSEIPENTLYPTLTHSNPSYPVILKPSTKYSIVTNSYSNSHTNSAINFNLGGATVSTTVGNRVTTITTPSTLTSEELVMSGRGNKLSHVMVVEGEVVGDEPYFEGICDCKSPILSNVGKNLFDDTSLKEADLAKENITGLAPIKFQPNKPYYVGLTLMNGVKADTAYFTIEYKDEDGIVAATKYQNTVCIFTEEQAKRIKYANVYTNKNHGQSSVFVEHMWIAESSETTPYEPYKSNILSCNGDKIELTADMFEQGTFSTSQTGATYESVKENSNTRIRSKKLMRVKPNTTYRFKIDSSCQMLIGGYDSNQKCLGSEFAYTWLNEKVFTTPANGHYISIAIRKGSASSDITPSEFNNTGLAIWEVDKTIVLRSLPNGACDTLNVETGEYVQRIGEVVLDGSSDETWKMQSDVGNGKTRFIVVNKTDDRKVYSNQRTTGYLLCDKFREVSFYDLYVEGKDGVAGWEAGKTISFVNGMTVLSDFISLISQSPITLHYELATPIIKTVDLSGYPFSYENGHVVLSSGSIEQSLTPKVEYSVPTNRNGQIRSNQKMVEKHQKELDKLQAVILANLINSQYQQTLTTLKYELSRV